MINHNTDVEKSIVNGAICSFSILKPNNGYQDCKLLNVDGYYVRCVVLLKRLITLKLYLKKVEQENLKLKQSKFQQLLNFLVQLT